MSAEPLTATTITDEQIRELLASKSFTLRTYAERALVVIEMTDSPAYRSVLRDRNEARARCAEILNARSK